MSKSLLKVRAVVAIGMGALLLLMFVTGVILWMSSQGWIQSATLWNVVFRIHPYGGWSLFLLGILHFSLNKKLFQSDLKALRNKS
jgi:cytochrome b subunit of formate dehydrogenase